MLIFIQKIVSKTRAHIFGGFAGNFLIIVFQGANSSSCDREIVSKFIFIIHPVHLLPFWYGGTFIIEDGGRDGKDTERR